MQPNPPAPLLKYRPAGATDVEKFLAFMNPLAHTAPHEKMHKPEVLMRIYKKGGHTMPVSADRCCDWKKTASGSLQVGQCLFERGS